MAPSTDSPGIDLLRIDDELTAEERLVRDTVRAFAADRIMPYIADWFEAGTLPRELAPEIGKLGLLGMHLTGYGCAGMNNVAYGLALQELERGSRPEEIEAARGAVDETTRHLDYLHRQRKETVVTAPAAGVIQSFDLRPGDLVVPNAPVATLLEPDQLWVRVYVPETKLGFVRMGQPAGIAAASSNPNGPGPDLHAESS